MQYVCAPRTTPASWEDVIKQSSLVYGFDAAAASGEQTDMDMDSFYGPPPPPYGGNRPPIDEYSERSGGAIGRLAGDEQPFGAYEPDAAAPDDTTAKYYPGTGLLMCKMDAECPRYESCVPLVASTVRGVCNCRSGYERIKQGSCIKAYSSDDDTVDGGDRAGSAADRQLAKALGYDLLYEQGSKADSSSEMAPVPSPLQKLSVSVVSKDVQLPEKEVTLAAYTVPDEKTAGVRYEYSWTLIAQPPGGVNGTMSDQTKVR